MRAKGSQRNAIFLLIGFIALVYLINLLIVALTPKAQLAAGGLFLIALGGLWIFLMGGPETLTCDREFCRIVRPRFLLRGQSVVAVPLSTIVEVRVDEVQIMSHDGPGRTGYQVVLRARDEVSYFFSVEDSQQSAKAIAKKVKAYLKSPRQDSLTVRRVPWGMIAIGAASIGFGVLLIMSALLGWPYVV